MTNSLPKPVLIDDKIDFLGENIVIRPVSVSDSSPEEIIAAWDAIRPKQSGTCNLPPVIVDIDRTLDLMRL